MRRLFCVLISVVAARAQCTMQNQSTCSALYSGGTPTLAAFVANTNTSFLTTWAQIAGKPQPPITLTAQIWPASVATIPGAASSYGPYIQTYMGLLKTGAGVTIQDVNIWPNALTSAAQYTGSIASDCAGGALLATNAGVPGGTGANSRCATLSYYDGMFSYAAAHGITLRVGFFPGVNPTYGATVAGLTPGSITESQYASWLIPEIQAAMLRWGTAISAAQVIEEPGAEGGMQYVQVFTVAALGTFIQAAAAAVKAIQSTTKVGAAYLGSDVAYWEDATASGVIANCTSGTTCAALDFAGIDLFSTSCTAAYSTTLSDFVQSSSCPACFLPNAAAVGKPVRIEQSDKPIFCPSSGACSQSTATLGADDDVWRSIGMQVAWQDLMVHWSSANGISSFAIYISLPLFNYTTNQAADNPVTDPTYSEAAMLLLAPTDAAVAYKALAQWPNASLQGNAYLSGNAYLH